MSYTSESSLIHPAHSNLAVLCPVEKGRLRLEVFPRRLRRSFGIEGELPLILTGAEQGPLRVLAATALDQQRQRNDIVDYLVEMEDHEGEPMAILIQGRVADHLPAGIEGLRDRQLPRVLFSIQEVTDVVRSRRKAAAVGAFHGLIGQSLPMLTLYQKIATYGPTEAAVLITGETGSGKELVARALHERSRRKDEAFVAVNCSALTPELFESELFGHEKGSFTGAYRQHKGRFQRADGGSLFLDEIGDMPAMTQSKMLRALEEGVIERVGGEREEQVDVRIIAATNIPLEQAVQVRRFRADLYHRLSVLRVHVPALRDREGDLPLLVEHFLEVFNRRYEKQIKRVTPEALRIMEDYHWPGNVRELRNVMERLVIEAAGEAIGARALQQWMEEREFLMPGGWSVDSLYTRRSPIPAEGERVYVEPARGPSEEGFADMRPPGWGSGVTPGSFSAWPGPPRLVEHASQEPPVPDVEVEDEKPREITEETIRDAYQKARGNLTRAAGQLGIHKATLYRHMKRLNLGREDLENGA